MQKYDDSSWHYGGDFPADLENEAGSTHIGMFINWCINNDLISLFQINEAGKDIQLVKDRKITGTEFLIANCDGKFTDEDLNDMGNEFTAAYYNDDTPFAIKHAPYLLDYCMLFEKRAKSENRVLESIYHVEDCWDTYDLLIPIIDKRFEEWKQFAKK